MKIVFDNLTRNEFRALYEALAQHVENVECGNLIEGTDDCEEIWFDEDGQAHSHNERLLTQMDAMLASLAD